MFAPSWFIIEEAKANATSRRGKGKKRMNRYLSELSVFWSNVVERLTIFDLIDILIVAFLIYQLMKLTRQTRANQVLKGIGIAFVAYWVADQLNFTTLKWILAYVMESGAVVLVILFQPELRRALEQIGRRTKIDRAPDPQTQTEIDQMIGEIVRGMVNLSHRKVGVLIVVEHKTGLADVIETGTILDSRISSALIENIFEPNTPLHDGAVVVRGTRIVAAGCFLPLTEENSISKQLGTRHRAALGVTENADCVSLVVSEETGTISVAQGGRLTRNLDAEGLAKVLRSIYEPDKESALLKNPLLKKWRAKK